MGMSRTAWGSLSIWKPRWLFRQGFLVTWLAVSMASWKTFTQYRNSRKDCKALKPFCTFPLLGIQQAAVFYKECWRPVQKMHETNEAFDLMLFCWSQFVVFFPILTNLQTPKIWLWNIWIWGRNWEILSLLTSTSGPLEEGPGLYIGLLDSAVMRDFSLG